MTFYSQEWFKLKVQISAKVLDVLRGEKARGRERQWGGSLLAKQVQTYHPFMSVIQMEWMFFLAKENRLGALSSGGM